ncbi:MAG: hypothetical protein IPK19_12330 [Chloroflexi bacterium]|nr:hypothetical protein [Chloroflexota bacterium]
MKNTINILAGLMIVVGGIWSQHGVGILPGSFMSGDPRWLVIGLVVMVLAIVMIAANRRRR